MPCRMQRDQTLFDEIRKIDWKVFARTDRHYVRLFDAERNLLTYLVVDKSGSMDYAGAVEITPRKIEHASRLAAARLTPASRLLYTPALQPAKFTPPARFASRLVTTRFTPALRPCGRTRNRPPKRPTPASLVPRSRRGEALSGASGVRAPLPGE